MSEEKTAEKEKQPWNVERVHKEVYDARTRIFVTLKVLETGAVDFKESPEWSLVIRPLLKDLIDNAQKIEAMMDVERSSDQSG